MRDAMLEFSDWPMFDRIMMEKDLCRETLEVILGQPISQIEYIVAEHDVRPTLSRHGVRLDAFAKTENEMYDIEMQTTTKKDLGRRLRYYQGAIDTLSLQRGAAYESLSLCYIIFICKHDAFGQKRPVYTLDISCAEDSSVKVGHGFRWVVLSAPYWSDLPSGRLRNLLHYVMTGEPGDDELTRKIDCAVSRANDDEAWRREKMELLTWEEDMEIQKRIAIRDSLAEGHAQGIAKGRAEGLVEGRAEGRAEGREEGLTQGREEGLAEGRTEGENRFGALVLALTEAGRSGDIQRAAEDVAVREALFEEFGLTIC